MAIEDKNKVTHSSVSSCDDFEFENGNNDDELNDKSSIIRKLALKCQNLLLKNELYENELSTLIKIFYELKQ